MRRAVYFRALLLTSIPCCFLAWSRLPGSSQQLLPLQLIVPGRYSLAELPPNIEGYWYALTKKDTTMSLVRVKVSVRPAKNPRATGDLSAPGAIVAVPSPDSILFLLRGPGLETRESVSTWFAGDIRVLPKEIIPFDSGKDRWSVSASKPEHWKVNPELVYRITVRDRMTGRSQDLGTWLSYAAPQIQWIGDLD